jgi:hypothetical protein
MNIIGVRGIETSVPLKRPHGSGFAEREQRMSQGDAMTSAGYAREAPPIGPRGTGAAQR